MDVRVERVRHEAEGQRRVRYSPAARADAVAFVQEGRAAGRTLSALASELGVSTQALRRWRARPRLPVVEETFTLPDGDRPCPHCGGQLEPMAAQCEEADEITVIERHFCVTRQRRQKYRCRCNGHVATAPGPVKLQPGARYAPAFAIEVAASKYLDPQDPTHLDRVTAMTCDLIGAHGETERAGRRGE
jgi:hypothetical protein